MRFYFPDSQDQIDPSFDFESEERSPYRIRQRDDLYAHEILDPCPYDGMLISKAIVDGVEGGAGKYSAQQRQRLYREGIREFYRLDAGDGPPIDTIGDCGAFQYVRDPAPPYTIDEVIDFYEGCGVDAGISLDHVILGFQLHPPLSEDCCRPNGRSGSNLRSISPRNSSRATAPATARSSPSGSPRAGAPRATRSRC